MAPGVLSGLRHFDAYTKPLEDFRVRTWSGGVVTLCCALVIGWLTAAELRAYATPQRAERLLVDAGFRSDGVDTVNIHFDIYMLRIPCDLLSVDAMDVSGEHQDDVQHSVWKAPLDATGAVLSTDRSRPERHEVNAGRSSSTAEPDSTTAGRRQHTTAKCGSCYGAETGGRKCCATCADVRSAYRDKGWGMPPMAAVEQCRGEQAADAGPWMDKLNANEMPGCRLFGTVAVAKVAGNVHIAPGDYMREQHAHVHDLHSIGPDNFNTTHRIGHLALGDTFEGKQFPLDGHAAWAQTGGIMYQYYLQIVPTTVVQANGSELFTYQFTSTKQRKVISARAGGDGLPGIFIYYDFSPIMVQFTLVQRSLTHLLVSLCAIVGGVYTVASLLDAALYHAAAAANSRHRAGPGLEKLT